MVAVYFRLSPSKIKSTKTITQMKTETKTVAEYRAPKCKVVSVHAQNLVCTSPGDGYGVLGAAGDDVTVENDDYGY